MSALCGFELGNRFVPGCLTDDENSRIHSCECDLPCSVARSEKTVYIEPIVSRLQDGSQLPEVGIGGGAGDLYQVHELELPDQASLEKLEKLCLERIHDSRVLSQTRDALAEAFRSKTKSLSLDSYGMKDDTDIPLEKLVTILSRGHVRDRRFVDARGKTDHLPNIIVSPAFLTIQLYDLTDTAFPLLPPLLIQRTMRAGLSIQTQRHLPLHNRPSHLGRKHLDPGSFRSPLFGKSLHPRRSYAGYHRK